MLDDEDVKPRAFDDFSEYDDKRERCEMNASQKRTFSLV